jgi:tetratricopeptide (TPR) repeat protein
MKGLISAQPNADGQYVAVMTTVMGEPWEDYADTLEQVLASARLADDASFGPNPMDQSDPATPDPAELAAQALERGQALQAEGDYVGALKAYRESLLLQPNDALLTRVETLERYLEVKGIDVPRQD